MLKRKVERIILDADDTLWENNKFYIDAEEQLTKILIQAGHLKEDINKRFEMVEKRVVDELGYGSKNFILILEELYKFYNRILRDRKHIFTFLFIPEVPPDNNASERAIRNIKVKP